MKRVILTLFFLTGAIFSNAQSWNPYVSQGIISPLLPEEFRVPGMVSFNLGNSGSSPLVFDRDHPENNLSVIIYLSNGVPDKKNPLSALKGPGVGIFDWSYDALTNTVQGVQKKDIPGYFQTSLELSYKVNHNSPLDVASNGFKIELKVPPYMVGANTTQDDMVSSFTATRAFNYGDAPESYGIARHEINLNKDPVTNEYNRFIMLGKLVNHAVTPLFSPVAGQDEKVGNDDDGVIFPLLSVGNTYTIPVTVTVHGSSFGLLNAWIDWNGDGDFLDSGERINASPIPVHSSGIISLPVTVPDQAVSNAFTFARFRIGGNSGPMGENSWGEVEDYRIFIHSAELTAQANVTQPIAYGETTGAVDLIVSGGKLPYSFEWSNGASTENISNLGPGVYKVIIRDADGKTFTISSTISWPEPPSQIAWGMDHLKISVYPNPVVDNYYVNINRQGKYRLELVNPAGSIVYNEVVEIASEKGNVIPLKRGKLVSGAYIMRVSDIHQGFTHNLKINMIQLK